MPDDIDSQPADGELEASGPSQTPSDTPPAEQPEQADQEAASTEESVEPADSAAPSQEASPADEAGDEPVSEPAQPASEAPAEELDTAAETVAADETLDWAAAETADKVLAEAQAAEGGGLDPEPAAVEDEPAEDLLLSQEELNDLLGQSDEFATETTQAATVDETSAAAPQPSAAAESMVAPEAAAPPPPPPNEPELPTEPVELPNFATSAAAAVENQIDLLHDVELAVKIELGRTEMYIEDVLRLGVGSVVELDKLAGDPVDIWVNSRLVARGEVLVLNDNFCVRVNEILSPIAETESE